MRPVIGESFARTPIPLLDGSSTNAVVEWARRFIGWASTQMAGLQRASAVSLSRTVAAATTATAADHVILANATGSAFAVTLPDPASVLEAVITIVRINGGGNAVTIGGTVSGAVNPTLGSQWAAMTVAAIGTPSSAQWVKISSV